MDRRAFLRYGAAGVLGAAAPARAQGRPPMRLVVPYPPGGTTDGMARVLAASLTRTLNRTVIVDNRSGAAGLLGVRAVQTAAPDGSVLLFGNPGMITLALQNRAAGFDPVRDFAPVGLVGRSPLFLMVHKGVPARTTAEFVAYAKAVPDGINSGSAGLGSNGHITAMLLARAAGIDITHVAYRGTSEAATALMAGEVKMQINSTTVALNEALRSGLVRFLAVMTERPTPLAPGVPAIVDTFPDLVVDTWFGFFGPAGTPPAVIEEVNAALAAALAEPEVRSRFLAGFIEPEHSSPEGMRAAVAASAAFWARAFRDLEIAPQ